MNQLQLMLIIMACEKGGNKELLEKTKEALAKKEKEEGEEECRQQA